jgi:hypothetical protein
VGHPSTNHGSRRIAANEERATSLPECVKPCPRNLQLVKQRVKVIAEQIILVQRCAIAAWKQKPGSPSTQILPEFLGNRFVNRRVTHAVGLGRTDFVGRKAPANRENANPVFDEFDIFDQLRGHPNRIPDSPNKACTARYRPLWEHDPSVRQQ